MAPGVGAVAHQVLGKKQSEAKPVARGGKRNRTEGGKRQTRADHFGDPLPSGAVARLGTLRFRHEGSCHSVAFSPDGKLLASTTTGATVVHWDASTGQERGRLQPPPGENFPPRIGSIDFSPDGRTLIASQGNSKLRLWVQLAAALIFVRAEAHGFFQPRTAMNGCFSP
jgi:hypothetical protein